LRRAVPELATLTGSPPAGREWLHEIKFDGYRILASLDRGRVELTSRNGKDWTARFPEIARAVAELPVRDALLDGEVVALDAAGASSFRRLQEALGAGRTRGLVYQAFDLLGLDERDLARAPLVERKRSLADLLARLDARATVLRYTDHVDGDGPALFAEACKLGLEGIVSKRAASTYRGGRTGQWLKIKCTQHEELVVGGFTEPAGVRAGFGALLLGAWSEGRLTYVGKVGTGFSARQLGELSVLLGERETATCPFAPPPRSRRDVRWVKPDLVAEVEFSEWTRAGVLRQPSFRGLREDRDAAEIDLDRLASTGRGTTGRAARPRAAAARSPAARAIRAPRPRASSGRSAAEVAHVRLSHPDRVVYPEQGVTKLDLAEFYASIADWILPQLVERPLSLVRCPRGRGDECFFQKHPGQAIGAHVPRTAIREKAGTTTYIYVRSLPDLVALVQAGTLEMHPWGARVTDLERPDTMVFDLDPGDDVAWGVVLDTARALRQRLAGLGLEGFARTTGGKGLHVVVPLEPEADWEQVKAFARGVARAHARDDSRRLTVNMSKAKRRGRIFLDYLRNARGSTAIASYSTRARPGAPVAVPVRWDELGPSLTSDRYHVENLRRRLTALRADPWEGFEALRRPLTARMLAAVAEADA
jgi:bifunctional non-homologous end joining protein LigD